MADRLSKVEDRVTMLSSLLEGDEDGASFREWVKDPQRVTASQGSIPLRQAAGEEESSDPRVMQSNIPRAGKGIQPIDDDDGRKDNMARRKRQERSRRTTATEVPAGEKDTGVEGTYPLGPDEMAQQWAGDYGSPAEVFNADADRTRQSETPQQDPTTLDPERMAQKDYGDYPLTGPDVVTKDAMADPQAAVRQAAVAIENAVTAAEKAARRKQMEQLVTGLVQKGAFDGNPSTAVDAGDYGSRSEPDGELFARSVESATETEEEIAEERKPEGGVTGATIDLAESRRVNAIAREAAIAFGLKGASEVFTAVRPLTQRELRTVIAAFAKGGADAVPGDWNQASIVDRAAVTIKNYMQRDPRANTSDLTSLITDLWRLSEAQAKELSGRLTTAMKKQAQDALEEMSDEALKAAYTAATDETEKDEIASVMGRKALGIKKVADDGTPAVEEDAGAESDKNASDALQQIIQLMRPVPKGGEGMTYANAKQTVERRVASQRTAISTSPDIQEGNVHTLASDKTKDITDAANKERESKFKEDLKEAWLQDWRKMAIRSIGLVREGRFTMEAVIDAIPDDVPSATRRMAIRRITTAAFGADSDLELTDKERLAPSKLKKGKGPRKTSPKPVEDLKKPGPGRPKGSKGKKKDMPPWLEDAEGEDEDIVSEASASISEGTTTKELSDKENKEREKKFKEDLKESSVNVHKDTLAALFKEGMWTVYQAPGFKKVAELDIDEVDIDELLQEFEVEDADDGVGEFLASEDYGMAILDEVLEQDFAEPALVSEVAPVGLTIGSRVKIAEQWLPTGEETMELVHDITQLRDAEVEGEVIDSLPGDEVEVAFGDNTFILAAAEIDRVADSEYERELEPAGGTDDVWSDETLETAEAAEAQGKQDFLGEQAQGPLGPDAHSASVSASKFNKEASLWKQRAASQLAQEMFRKKLLKVASDDDADAIVDAKAQELMRLDGEGFYQVEDTVKSAAEPGRGLKDPMVMRGKPTFEDPLDDPNFFS